MKHGAFRSPRELPDDLAPPNAREPIHVPGHIQPHGVLIATAPGERRISHVSDNIAASLGLKPAALLGLGLDRLVGSAGFAAMEAAVADSASAPSNVVRFTLPVAVRPRRKGLVHRHHNRLILELEDAPASRTDGTPLVRANRLMSSLRHARTVAELCDITASELRQQTGYGRVMIIRFDAADQWTVIADHRSDGLAFCPDPDNANWLIPDQPPVFHALRRVCAIPDAEYRPVRLLADDPAPLDMSLCALRGVAPTHLALLRRIGVRACLVVSLTRGDAPWGMIVCHHPTPKLPSAEIRSLCDVTGQLLSTLLPRVTEAEALRDRLRRTRMLLQRAETSLADYANTRGLLHQAETRLADLAAYDPLTGLANRRTIEALLKLWQAESAPGAAAPGVTALVYIDLDRFKVINDTLGQQAGDDCLVDVAARLRHAAPAGSVAGRLGGDEFILLWPDAGPAQAFALAQALVAELARPFALHGRPYHTGVSIGVTSVATASLEDAMRQADAAMYAAKQQGGGRAIAFQPALHAAVLADMETEQELYHAFETGALDVHFQPLIAVADQRISGFEALVRWHHPKRGWISPAAFIPRAEATGLIARIGSWVMAEAVHRLGAWRRLHPDLTMSVNVSARQLTDGFLRARLPRLLAEAAVAPSALCLEVTETALMDAQAVPELVALRALGIKIGVDDFGTGHSALSYLQNLPVDVVKIDRGFVAPLGAGGKADRFFAAIVDLARTIELRTIAEGCETLAQWQVIKATGCETVQGWLFAPALDAAAAARLLAAPPAWPLDDPSGAGC
jgi:diguanylate cyclase (GGDEF)-like protein